MNQHAFINKICNALSQITHASAEKKFHCLCPNSKPNQQLSYSLGENQPTYKILLLGNGMKN